MALSPLINQLADYCTWITINMRFDLYGHLFENIEADRADMAKIEAAVRAA